MLNPTRGAPSLDNADLTLNAAELKGAYHRVYCFGNHFEEK